MNKIIIYQIFTRLFGNRNTSRIENGTIAENGCGKFNDFDAKTLKQIKNLGITHIWYTGVIRHATQTDYTKYGIPRNHPAIVKGKAGSPYAITDYYDVDPDLAIDVNNRMEEFEAMLQRTHKAGMKVIIDFVPNHVARQYHSLMKPDGVKDLGEDDNKLHGFDPQNNFYYCPGCNFSPYFDLYNGETEPYQENPAKATGNDHFGPCPGVNEWYETVKLNYGVDYYAGRIGYFDPVPNTWHKMLDILLFWSSKGVDGFRCDMAEMVPAEFWGWATNRVKSKYSNIIFIGEVYNPSEYRNYISNGFDYLYDKVGMYDTMRAATCGQCNTSAITHAWQANDDIRSHMLYFLENHDEQRVASTFFAGEGKKGIPAFVASVLMQQNPFMLYAGEEYGESGMDKEGFSGLDGRTTIFDYWSIDTLCRATWNTLNEDEKNLYELHQKVLRIANKEQSICNGAFFDLMYANNHLDKQYVFIRRYEGEMLLIAVNFDTRDVCIGVNIPEHAFNFLNMEEVKVQATDLLTNKKKTYELKKDSPIAIQLGASGAVVMKMKC
jgi:glycosidase